MEEILWKVELAKMKLTVVDGLTAFVVPAELSERLAAELATLLT